MFYERYINGETKAVYDEIAQLGQNAFSPNIYSDVEKVLDETFNRVAFNLNVVFSELQQIGYNFKTVFAYNFEKPIHSPLPETDLLLDELEDIVRPYGFVPVSLKKFYKIVGACNFVWDYETNANFFWDCADPIQICSLDGLISYSSGEDWIEQMEENINDNSEDFPNFPYLELAADYLHKDNISGGLPYCIQITQEPTIDSLFLNDAHNTTFIDYLRICFEYCGFSNMEGYIDEKYERFYEKTFPQLKPF